MAYRSNGPRPPRILLYSGWATHNIGDIGHTPGTLRYLSEQIPNAVLFCWLRKTSEAVTAMLKRRFPQVMFVEGTLDEAGHASTPELQAAFDGADLFIQNSGMHVTRYWPAPLAMMRACVNTNKPFGLYGHSFDGFRDEDAPFLPDLLSRAAFIFCRDTESLQFLRHYNGGMGVNPPVLEFGPDGCFGIDVRDDARAHVFMQANQLVPRKFLTVTLRTDKEISKNERDKAIESAETIGPAEWAAKLREIITDYVTRTGNKVALVPEVEKEIGPARELLYLPLPDAIRLRVVWKDTFWNANEAVSLYAQAQAVLSLEPHSCIIALAQGTPAIHLFTRRHGNKAWMFRDIGLSEWLIDVDREPDRRVTDALIRIENQYDLALAKTRRAMQSVHSRAEEMMSDVRRALPVTRV